MENLSKQSETKDVPSVLKDEEIKYVKIDQIKKQLKEICDLDRNILNQLDCCNKLRK